MSYDDAERLIAGWRQHPHVRVHVLGKSLGGRNLYRLTITDPSSHNPPARRWVHHFANQHPLECCSQWRIAGMIDWLLSDEAVQHRQRTICHFTLMMSPDAASHGWYRTNGQGFDMNRTYRAEGADKTKQAHEAYVFQSDLEALVDCNSADHKLGDAHLAGIDGPDHSRAGPGDGQRSWAVGGPEEAAGEV